MAATPILRLLEVEKKFGDIAAVDHVDLDIEEGEFFTVVGPSGSGKTTLIRMLVGMDKPTSGDILLRGARINDVPANQRPTCMVFQSLALFPHMTVGENVEYPGKMQGRTQDRTACPRPSLPRLCASARKLLRQAGDPMLRRRTPARGAGTGACL